jgi:hypothetical protein
MVLTSVDLGGAKVISQGYYKDNDFPSVISYGRELEDGKLGSVALPWAGSDAEVGKSVTASAITLGGTKKYLGTKQARKDLEELVLEESPFDGVLGDVQVGKPRDLGAGEDSFDLLVVMKMLGKRAEFHIAAFRVDRVLGLLGAIGNPGRRVPLATMTRLAKIMAARMVAELTPKSTAPPTISGTPAVGQTLTASTGSWSGKPTSFSHQWQRCDAAGTACTPIVGATGQTYVVAEADTGATLQVAVTARNAVGARTASSAPTAVIQAAGAPVNTSPPTITGVAQVGQTLTATTGSWNGSPTSFSFQWCWTVTGGCAPIPGATAGTYVVGAADVGRTIQVGVFARNSLGTSYAVSAPTAPVT